MGITFEYSFHKLFKVGDKVEILYSYQKSVSEGDTGVITAVQSDGYIVKTDGLDNSFYFETELRKIKDLDAEAIKDWLCST